MPNVNNPNMHNLLFPQGIKAPAAAPQQEDQLAKIRQQQTEQAKSFRAGLPGEQARQNERLQSESRLNLANRLGGVNRNMASRGLMYSGLNQGAQAQERASAAGDLAGNIAQSNAGLENQAQGLENTAVQGGLQQAGLAQGRADLDMAQALEQRRMQQQAQSGLFGAVGGLLGGMAGRK